MADESPANRYRLVVQHQLSVEQAVSMECVTSDRATAAEDIGFFIGKFTDAHEEARQRAFAEAEKHRDLLFQKIANLQEEAQRLEGVVRELKQRKVRAADGKVTRVVDLLGPGVANGDSGR